MADATPLNFAKLAIQNGYSATSIGITDAHRSAYEVRLLTSEGSARLILALTLTAWQDTVERVKGIAGLLIESLSRANG